MLSKGLLLTGLAQVCEVGKYMLGGLRGLWSPTEVNLGCA